MSTPTPDPNQRRQRRPAVPVKARNAFLEAIAAAYSISAAASRAGVHRRRLYELREVDEAFAKAWDDAYEQGTDVVRDEIRRRAVEGWEEPVYQRGELVGHVRRFSDRLLELEAKRRDPSYREQRLELTGSVGIDHRAPDLEAALARFDEQVRRLAAGGLGEVAHEREAMRALPPGSTDDASAGAV